MRFPVRTLHAGMQRTTSTKPVTCASSSLSFDTVQATHNIKNEADSHLGLLDKMVRQHRRVP